MLALELVAVLIDRGQHYLLVVDSDFNSAQVFHVTISANKSMTLWIHLMPTKVKLEFAALVLTARFLYS